MSATELQPGTSERTANHGVVVGRPLNDLVDLATTPWGKPDFVCESDRKAYFVPFWIGRKFCCGAQRTLCPECRRKQVPERHMFKNCSECGADLRCRRAVIQGSNRCAYHGGHRQPSTLSNRQPETGANQARFYHRALASSSPELARRFAEAYECADLQSLRPEYAVVQMRLEELLSGLAQSHSAEVWNQLGACVLQMQQLIETGNDDDLMPVVQRMRDLIESGLSHQDAWSELLEISDRVTDLKKQQAGIERDRRSNLSAAEALLLIDKLYASVSHAFSLKDQAWANSITELSRGIELLAPEHRLGLLSSLNECRRLHEDAAAEAISHVTRTLQHAVGKA